MYVINMKNVRDVWKCFRVQTNVKLRAKKKKN